MHGEGINLASTIQPSAIICVLSHKQDPMKTNVATLLKAPLLFVLLMLFNSCKNDDPANEENMVCGTAKPVEELPWLNKKFKAFYGGKESNAIVLYQYDGQQVIEIQNAIFSSTNQHQYLCNGDKLDFNDANKYKDFVDNRQEIKILYGTKIWH